MAAETLSCDNTFPWKWQSAFRCVGNPWLLELLLPSRTTEIKWGLSSLRLRLRSTWNFWSQALNNKCTVPSLNSFLLTSISAYSGTSLWLDTAKICCSSRFVKRWWKFWTKVMSGEKNRKMPMLLHMKSFIRKWSLCHFKMSISRRKADFKS